MTLIASFLAGSLLSLLMPTILLICLVVWYMIFIRRIPETLEGERTAAPAPNPTASPGPGPELSRTSQRMD